MMSVSGVLSWLVSREHRSVGRRETSSDRAKSFPYSRLEKDREELPILKCCPTVISTLGFRITQTD